VGDTSSLEWRKNMDRRLRKTKYLAAALTLMLAVAACDDGETDPTDPVDGVTTTVAEMTTTTAAG
jgi:hypothetical protein